MLHSLACAHGQLMIVRVLHLLDGLQHGPIAARLKRVPGVSRAYRVSRGQIVRERARFMLAELFGLKSPQRYGLRDTPGEVVIRHGPSDIGILAEFFWYRVYEPPAEVDLALQVPGPIEIVDLGGHVGMFGVWARARWPGCRITSVEADPENAAVCERTIAANGAQGDWNLIGAAASNREGALRFSSGRHAQSAVDPVKGDIEVPAIDALPLLSGADVVKIDIEGGEWQIFGDPRFREIGAKVIAFEFHPHLAPGPDTGREAGLALERAGFVNRRIEDLPGGLGLGWAWRDPGATGKVPGR